MSERMNNIMSIVKSSEPLGFKDFEELDEKTFAITTDCPDCYTFVRWSATNYLNVNISRVFGYLDLSQKISLEDLVKILRMNYEGYQGTGTFLGIVKFDTETVYASQSTNLIFLPKWNDEDIADVISTAFTRISTTVYKAPHPIVEYSIELPTNSFLAKYTSTGEES